MLPSFFVTSTTGLTQGLFELVVTPCFNIDLINFLVHFPRAKGAQWGNYQMGWYVPVSMVCYTTSVHPSSGGSIINTSLNLATILCNSLPSISVKVSSRSPKGATILETFLNKYCIALRLLLPHEVSTVM